MGRVEGYRNFCNKLWNAARFVLMSTEAAEGTGPEALSQYDRWIRSRLQAAIAAVRDGFAAYRFDQAAQAAYEFTWYEFCDWYLEFSKAVLQSQQGTIEERRGTRRTLIETLETLLRLLHPLMPFITEEIWQRVAPRAGKQGDSIMRQPFPALEAAALDPLAEAGTAMDQKFVLAIRQVRGELDIAPLVRPALLLEGASADQLERFTARDTPIWRLAGIGDVRALAPGEPVPQSATALVGELKIHVPMAGLIDVEAELARLGKRRSKLEQELLRAEAKLDNENFVRNAPPAVIAQERARVVDFKRELAQVAEQHQRVALLK
jgi:valyl-tRNA synthetase